MGPQGARIDSYKDQVFVAIRNNFDIRNNSWLYGIVEKVSECFSNFMRLFVSVRATFQYYIGLKQAIGYKQNAEAGHLKRFDQFMLEKYPEATTLTKEIVIEWCRKKTYEAQANQCMRASFIRQFGKYLDSIGVAAYIIPKGYYPVAKQYMPYIYTVEEMTKFFAETDKCKYCYECPHRHHIMPVIFRMIYMGG